MISLPRIVCYTSRVASKNIMDNNKNQIILYCIVLYCIVLYYIILVP